jgi:prephenate dehydrogenase
MLDSAADPPLCCDTLVIAGVGLIGGAIARAARQSGAAGRIIGLGRSTARLAAARAAGLIDHAAEQLDDVRGADAAVVCTPVDRIADDVRALQCVLAPEGWITDAGSVKRLIVESVGPPAPGRAEFVGGHPLAGSEKHGFEFAAEVELAGRVCVVTPADWSTRRTVPAVTRFWQTLGMRVVSRSPDEHDAVLARTSHAPHLAAYLLASLLQPSDGPFAASGFRDTTRIARSDPALWTAILLANRDAVLQTAGALERGLAAARAALEQGDAEALRALLATAQERRQSLDPPG